MEANTASTPMTDLQQAQRFLSVFEPVVARGIENYPFEPSVKGDMLYSNEDIGSWMESITYADATLTGKDWIFSSENRQLNLDTMVHEFRLMYQYYIPTLDQLMDYVWAFNESQKELAHFYYIDYLAFCDDRFLMREYYQANGLSTSRRTIAFKYDSPDTTLKIALAQVVVECENIVHGQEVI